MPKNNIPIIGEQRPVYPQIAMQIVAGNNVILDIVESPIKITRIMLEERIIAQLFISYGSTCLEFTVRDMLQARAMNLGKLPKETLDNV